MFTPKQKVSVFCCLVILALAQLVSAGTTGKIAGTVKELASGEALAGANVIVEGTTLGAAVDMNGNYTILYIPPGVYTVKVQMMGYKPVSVSDVRVRIDQTERVNFSLEQQVIEGEEVTVVAERKMVKEDVATSVSSVSTSELQVLPINTVQEVVGLQAGVENGLNIRGGGANELLFQVNGVTLRDARNNQPITGIALSAIQEISIERGGFNAEYGQVRSGIVNVVTKEGGKSSYSGTITVKYAPPAAKHFGISPYDSKSMFLRPYLDPVVAWEGTEGGAWDYFTQRQYPQFDGWNKISDRLMSDDDPSNDLTPQAAQRIFMFQHRRQPVTDQPDYNIDGGFGGPVPFISESLGNLRFFTSYRREREMLLVPLTRDDYLEQDWSLHLTSDLSPALKLRLSTQLGNSFNVAVNGTEQEFSTQYIRTPWQIANNISNRNQLASRVFSNSYYSLADVSYRSFSAKLTHMLNPMTFYEASVEHVARKYDTRPTDLRNSQKNFEIVPGYFVDEGPFGWSPSPDVGIGDGMFFGGHTSTARDQSQVASTTFKFDLTSQVNFNNLVKTGAELVYTDLNLDYGVVNLVFPESNNYVKLRKFPVRGAIYLQDKLEAKGFIINGGLRLDYHNANTDWVNLLPFDKNFFSSRYRPNGDFTFEKAKSELTVSPRLGISHPITENSKLYFNYGHFKQLPTYEQMFRQSRGASNQIRNIGDPNLAMEKTVSYELGYDHALYNDLLIQLAAFYHDITDQQFFTTYISADATINYQGANNNSYEDIRGFELTLNKPRGRWWTGFANYTYQVNTSGFFGTDRIYEDPSLQRQWEQDTRRRYQNRPIPQPYARASISFYTPGDFGPELAGMKPASNWHLNFITDWREGSWLTWNPQNIPGISQNVQMKNWFNAIMRLTKKLNLGTMEMTFFVDVGNLLNTKRLSLAGFYDANDYIDYFSSLHLPASRAYSNIKGDDKIGTYRKEDVDYQPVLQLGNVNDLVNPNPKVIYYEKTSGRYMNYGDGAWSEVAGGRMDKILKDKAYIDMPNNTSFNFLEPRNIFFGIRTSFNLR